MSETRKKKNELGFHDQHTFAHHVSEITSLTDKAERISLMVGLTLLIVLRLTSIGGMDPPDMTVNFFGIIPPPLGVATVVPVNFAQNS